MPGPTKPYDETKIGQQVQANYTFLEQLFGPNQAAFRQSFFDCTTESALRQLLQQNGIDVPSGVRIVLVDLEKARLHHIGPLNIRTESFYQLVMPPVPRRSTVAEYKDDQQWEDAWHHAIVDSYGM